MIITGTRLWAISLGNAIRNSPAIGPNGLIFINANSAIFAISLDGDLKWTYQASPNIVFGFSSPTISNSGILYIGTNTEGMMALQVNDTGARLLWQSADASFISTTAALSNDNTQVIFGSNNFKLYSVDALTGKLIWNYTTGNIDIGIQVN